MCIIATQLEKKSHVITVSSSWVTSLNNFQYGMSKNWKLHSSGLPAGFSYTWPCRACLIHCQGWKFDRNPVVSDCYRLLWFKCGAPITTIRLSFISELRIEGWESNMSPSRQLSDGQTVFISDFIFFDLDRFHGWWHGRMNEPGSERHAKMNNRHATKSLFPSTNNVQFEI